MLLKSESESGGNWCVSGRGQWKEVGVRWMGEQKWFVLFFFMQIWKCRTLVVSRNDAKINSGCIYDCFFVMHLHVHIRCLVINNGDWMTINLFNTKNTLQLLLLLSLLILILLEVVLVTVSFKKIKNEK